MNFLESISKPQYLFKPRQAILRLIRLYQKGPDVTKVVLPWGLEIRISPQEKIGRVIWNQGLYDITVSETLWRLLDAGDTAIDVGANIGHMTSIMALRVGQAGKVLSFEPHPEIFEELRHNIELFRRSNKIGEITPIQIALSNSSGIGYLICDDYFKVNRGVAYLANSESNQIQSGITVSRKTLDEFVRDTQISVMKLDVEGHELDVLKGGEKTLESHRVKNIVYEDFGGAQSPVHELLTKYGYSLYALGSKTLGPVLSSVEDGPKINLAKETPNYLATVEVEKVLNRFSGRGWFVL